MESPATTTMRRPCFMGEDDGLASIAEFSGNTNINNHHINNKNDNNNFVNYQNNHQPYMMRRKNSLRNISSLSTTSTYATSSAAAATATTSATVFSPRSGRLFDPRFEEVVHSPHFLESCSLCHKPLGGNRDIFMYRGDTPFCSEECRQEQIETDEAKEKNWNLKALRAKKESKKSSSSSSPSKAQNYSFRTGTVAAA